MLNKKNILIFSFLFLFIVSLSHAQKFSRGKARLKGIVKNEAGAPLENALVILTHEDGVSKFVKKTNKKGAWSFIGLGSGDFQITINLKGYKQKWILTQVYQLSRNPIIKTVLKKETISFEPKRIRYVRPILPKAALRAQIHGTVILNITVGSNGDVGKVKVIAGHQWLRGAAIYAVKRWKYEPFKTNNKIKSSNFNVKIKFHIYDSRGHKKY